MPLSESYDHIKTVAINCLYG